VNKADRPGSDRLVKDLKMALHLREGEALKDVPAHHGVDLRRAMQGQPQAMASARPEESPWEIPVLSTVAQSGQGIQELLDAIARHRDHLETSGLLEKRRRTRAMGRVRDVVQREFQRLVEGSEEVRETLENGVDRILSGEATPYSLGATILESLLGGGSAGFE
jgi:LAO/AO transport system kinase